MATKTNSHNKFAHGSGCYTCTVCGRKTRQTNPDAAGLRQCAECYEVGGLENAVSDGHDTDGKMQARIVELNEVIKSKGGVL
jgi:hypothetical protein